MKFIPKQCKVCPFRKKSLPGWLGSYDVGSIFREAWHNQLFACHAEVEGQDGNGYDRPDWKERAENGKVCVGFLKFANLIPAPTREGHPFIIQARRLVEKVKNVDCMRPNEFREHHEEGMKKR